MTAGREGGTAGALGLLRTSHAEREQAIDVLKAAFVQGRLTKDEFDLRVGQVLASRTYADLDALSADIPDGVTSAQPSAEHTREPGRVLSFKTAARVGAVGAGPSMASAAVMLVQSGEVPGVIGVLLVGVTGLVVAGLLAALLMLLSWIVRRAQREAAPGPPSGPAGLASRRRAPGRQLPSAAHDPLYMVKRPGTACLAYGLARFRAAVTFWPWTAADSGGAACYAVCTELAPMACPARSARATATSRARWDGLEPGFGVNMNRPTYWPLLNVRSSTSSSGKPNSSTG